MKNKTLLLTILVFFFAASAQAATFRVDSTANDGDAEVNAATVGACLTPPSGMTNWFTADDSVNDIQGGANAALRNGATYAPGKVGQAFSFDGVDDFVKLPDNFFPYPPNAPAGAAFTFEAWFKTASSGVIFGQQTTDPFNSPSGWVPGIWVGTDGKLRASVFYSGSTANVITSAGAVNDNAFHHVAVTYDGTTQTLYLDGNLVGSKAHTQVDYATVYKYQLGTGYTAFWAGGNGGWLNFNGLID